MTSHVDSYKLTQELQGRLNEVLKEMDKQGPRQTTYLNIHFIFPSPSHIAVSFANI